MTEMEITGGTEENWKLRAYIIGGAVGAAVGLATAFLLARSSEKSTGGPPDINVSDALKLSVGVIGLVRGIAALGD